MICKKCGFSSDDVHKFCPNCGHKIKNSIKSFFKILAWATVLLILIFIGSEFINFEDPFPAEKSEPKEISLTCDYKGNELVINHTLHGNVNQFYKNSDKYSKVDYVDYVYEHEEDETFNILTNKILAVANDNKLTSDQTLDLTACFIQNIPYDEAKADRILNYNESIEPRLPYETIYENSGVCSDKSFLGALIFKKLGYGVSFFEFNEQQHIATAIRVPSEYGNYSSNYAFMELTGEGLYVGDIPVLDEGRGQGSNEYSIYLDYNSQKISDSLQLGRPSEIIEYHAGKEYQLIAKRAQIYDKMAQISRDLKSKDTAIINCKSELTNYETQTDQAYEQHKLIGNQPSYNRYLNLYNNYKRQFDYCDSLIKDYNNNVDRLENLLDNYELI
jgi:hypothetical protein